ncbi:MAG: glycosyltransferase [Flavonifractor plautii]
MREYIYDMPLVMAAADLVLCRAGASTIAEIAAIAKPAVLVPSPTWWPTTRPRMPGCWPTPAARYCCRRGSPLERSCTRL